MAELGGRLILSSLTGLFAADRTIEAMHRRLPADGTTLGDDGRLMSLAEFNFFSEHRRVLTASLGSGWPGRLAIHRPAGIVPGGWSLSRGLSDRHASGP
jgi:hypothetical protein